MKCYKRTQLFLQPHIFYVICKIGFSNGFDNIEIGVCVFLAVPWDGAWGGSQTSLRLRFYSFFYFAEKKQIPSIPIRLSSFFCIPFIG